MLFLVPPDPQSPLALNCLVLGESRQRIFTVEIAGTKSVGSLKQVIKEKKHPAFQHIVTDSLALWEVSEVVDLNLENNLEKLNFPQKEPLSPLDELSKVFSNLPVNGRLHIVVGRPADGRLSGSLCENFVLKLSKMANRRTLLDRQNVRALLEMMGEVRFNF